MVIVPPPCSISPAPAMMPSAIEVAEDLEVVVVDLIFQALLADLVEAVELVEVDGISVRHNHAVEDNGHAALLAETGGADLLGLAQHDRSLGDEDVLVVVRVDRIRYEHLHRAGGIAVKPIHQHRVQRRSLIDHIRLARWPSRC